MLRELTLELDDLMRGVQRGRIKAVAVFVVIFIKGLPEAVSRVQHLHVSRASRNVLKRVETNRPFLTSLCAGHGQNERVVCIWLASANRP
jgi:hypothetical protein